MKTVDSSLAELSADDLSTLVRCARELSAQVEVTELFRHILDLASELTDSPDGSIILHNEERQTLYFAGATGPNAAMLLEEWGETADKQVPLTGSKAGQVFTTGETLVIQEIEDDPSHYKGVDRDTRKSTQSMICVPLAIAGHALGVMQVLNKRHGPYTPRDRVLLEHFGALAAVAIRNARLFDSLVAHMGLYGSKDRKTGRLQLLDALNQPARTEKLTVMFADMRSFSQLCQVLNDPAETQRFLNDFLGMLTSVVLAHRGVVNKFLGDGLLALFRDEDHERRAVSAAFVMLERFRELSARWEDVCNESLAFVDIGIGITTDAVVIGPIGSQQVRDFTVLGSAVNLAAAFEHDARGGRRVLVDQRTYAAVRDVVEEVEGPVTYLLRKPDQTVGHPYKQYHLKRLVTERARRIFISHSHHDRDFVERKLVEPLTQAGMRPWYSRVDVKAGELWLTSIHKALEASDWVVVVVSKHAAESEWVRKEVHLALTEKRLESRILPLTLDETLPKAITPWLATAQAVNASDAGSTEALCARIVAALGP